MDIEVKERWVSALRSGEYEQTDGVLMRELPSGKRGWCCLGVLCDIAVQDGILDAPTNRADTDIYTDEEREAIRQGYLAAPNEYAFKDNLTPTDPSREYWQHEVLPLAVQRWAGLTQQNPPVMVEDWSYDPEVDEPSEQWQAIDLAELNDDQGYSFAMIADAIEQDGEL